MSVSLETVAQLLGVIATPPNLRSQPRSGDLEGDFDHWFDGGAIKVVTGWNEYHFADSNKAIVPTTPVLSVMLELGDGRFVQVLETDREELPRWARILLER